MEQPATPELAQQRYRERFAELRESFLSGTLSSVDLLRARSSAADALVQNLWAGALARDGESALSGLCVVAVGGYGREELFPASDVDLLFVAPDGESEAAAKNSIRAVTQQLWDSGMRVSASTRVSTELTRFNRDNAEFTLSLFDMRQVAGEAALGHSLQENVSKFVQSEKKSILVRLLELVEERHARYGHTLFHLEPNIKECPGGLRDANVCGWLAHLVPVSLPGMEFAEAFRFLAAVRCLLHLRTGRDSNTLDWKTQDEAAAAGIGTRDRSPREAAQWMQMYFRHARVVARRLSQQMEALPRPKPLFRVPQVLMRRGNSEIRGMRVERGRVTLDEATGEYDPAHDAELVLRAFLAVAETGLNLDHQSEMRLEDAVPTLHFHFEGHAALWERLRLILLGTYAGQALRSMHALGLLEMLLPEFHGIDALVVRDAYHRYTVDEHTFVVIDSLHSFATADQSPLGEWKKRFAAIAHDLQHPDLLYLASLLHDTGKGRSTGEHTAESAGLAASVLTRLELDEYQSQLVLSLIRNHLEMSAALRRDIFDAETVRAFAAKVQAPEELRMLTLFTFADIYAVHPDALTPWKAENLWRLYMATSNYLDRNIDDERVDARVSSELVLRVTQSLQEESRDVLQFLEGFPQRYLQTRSPEQIRAHYRMSRHLAEDSVQLHFVWHAEQSDITLVTPDRQLLFSRVAGVLAAWGMNIITADAFSNARGIVVDSFRFTDSYKTLEMNASERERLVQNVHDAVIDPALAAQMMSNRKRSRQRQPLVKVDTSIHFDTESSTHSTLLQVVSQDVPGLLYTVSTTLGEACCDIQVALIDTEGDTAIDVFYLTRQEQPLHDAELAELRAKLITAIQQNAI